MTISHTHISIPSPINGSNPGLPVTQEAKNPTTIQRKPRKKEKTNIWRTKPLCQNQVSYPRPPPTLSPTTRRIVLNKILCAFPPTLDKSSASRTVEF
ncbi:hypothetical protein BO82DRAFT_4194 [Aspergillus uvarum CBS 121591]|uniref:Uncharacterized protein n=1 Tax=Aspergillus uvarum CBS 121591 TaxID=1448315 RepID=A0A319CRT0_9EURO|nr:hypothetical protein BO82DRAFT_4194 [Aspergillus uvarum CBS 121591]PYH87159.1 hypothetical protein BO82DRAFT_4194 [Aspergillus uvarum CBS 121591]